MYLSVRGKAEATKCRRAGVKWRMEVRPALPKVQYSHRNTTHKCANVWHVEQSDPNKLTPNQHIVPPASGATPILILIAITLLAAIVVLVDIPNTSKFMHVLHKTGHPVVFGLVALFVLRLVATRNDITERPIWVRYAVAFVITVVIGAMTEIAQLFTNRGAAVADVMSDAIGAAACLAWHAAIFSSGERRIRPAPSRYWCCLRRC